MAYRTSQYVLFGKPGIGRDCFAPVHSALPSFYTGAEDDSDVTPRLAPNDPGERPGSADASCCSLPSGGLSVSGPETASSVPGGLKASTRLLCHQCAVWSGSAKACLGPEEGSIDGTKGRHLEMTQIFLRQTRAARGFNG